MSSIQQLTNALENKMTLSWEEQDGSSTLITLNQDDWKVLDEDHEDNEWGEPILYEEETTRSITLEFIRNQKFCECSFPKFVVNNGIQSCSKCGLKDHYKEGVVADWSDDEKTMETCSKCETKIDTDKEDGWDYCSCLDAHFCRNCSPTNTCSCEGDGSCDCANCDEEAWADEEIYRHYECCECGKDIEEVGRLYDDVMCLECEEKGDDEKTNEDDNASPKELKEEVCNTSISSMDAQQKEIDLLTEYRAIWEEWKKIDEFYKPNPEYPKCVLCKEHLSGTPYGNNPQPIRKKGKCCDRCNNDKVIPARMSGSILGGNPFGSLDEQILCRKIQRFTPREGKTDKYPRIWEAFQADQLEDEIADVIQQFYQMTMERGVFPIIKDDGVISFTDVYSAIKDGKAFIRGIKK